MEDQAQREGMNIGEEILRWVRAARPKVEELAKAFVPLAEAFLEFPDRLESSLLLMAEHGWFLVASMPPGCSFEVAHALREGRIEDADGLMCQYAEEDLELVLSEVASAFPRRVQIVEKALKAHRGGDYELSIPVLLAQADGMATEKLQAGLYAKEREHKKAEPRPKLRVPVENALGNMSQNERFVYASFVEPLRHLWPLSAATAPSGSDRVLNRHAILHGESTDYAVRKLSCQAICVASYVALALDVLTRATTDRPTPLREVEHRD